MNLTTDRGNPLLSAYSLVRSSGLLRTSLGRRLFESAYFIYKRYIEDDLQGVLRAFPNLIGDGNILDVGANIGYTATVLANAARADRKVYAFEPEPFNFGILEQVAKKPGFRGKLLPRHLAVGAEEGTTSLWINDRHHADHRVITKEFRSTHTSPKEVRVSMVSIDSFVKSNPGPISFVKIDVQGYELPVCRGMQETIRSNPEITIVLEFMPSIIREMGFEPSDLIDFFASQGFTAYEIHSHGRLTKGVPVAQKDSDYFDLLFSRREFSV